MSAKTRQAVTLIATQAKTVQDAADIVGMNRSALSRAINRPDVAEYLAQRKQAFALEMDDLKGTAKRLAIRTGIELLGPEYPATVRARMVEFFAGEDRSGPSVQVNIGAQTGYEYVRPGARIVDVTPSDDTGN